MFGVVVHAWFFNFPMMANICPQCITPPRNGVTRGWKVRGGRSRLRLMEVSTSTSYLILTKCGEPP